jgi:putative polyketide hydroxylase
VNGDDLWLMHHFLQPGENAADYPPERLAGIIRESSGLPDIPVEVLGVTQWVMSPKVAMQFRKGRVFLTGDASARLSPAAGLGMNTGLQSAHNLAWKLTAVLRGAPESLLDSYDAERRGHVMRTFEMSNDFGSEVWEILEAGFGGDFDRVRDLVANSRRAGAGLGIDLGWRYERGAFVAEREGSSSSDLNSYAPTAEPGRRAPHIGLERNGQGVSSIELLGRGFALLVSGSSSEWLPAVEVAKQPGGFDVDVLSIGEGGEWRDADDAFRSTYGVERGGAVLVRPDGVVGWRAVKSDPSGLGLALDSILRGG